MTPRIYCFVWLLVFVGGAALVAKGQLILTKADNTTTLDQAPSWIQGSLPNAGAVGVWNSTIQNNFFSDVGSGVVLGGIEILNPAQAVTITGANGGLTLGNATIANAIDLTNATANLTIAANLTLATSQTWDLATNSVLTVSGNISGTSTSLTTTGNGTVVLSGNNSYTGDTFINGGTVNLGGNNALPSTGNLTINGGILNLGNFNATVNTLTLVNGNISTNTTTFPPPSILTANSLNVQSGNINVSVNGTGGLTKTTNGTVSLEGTNITNTGPTSVQAGTLVVDALQYANLSAVTVASGATLIAYPSSYASPYFGSLAGSGTLQIENTVYVGVDNSSTTFSGNIIGVQGGLTTFTKVGTGNLTLSGVNTNTYLVIQSGGLLLGSATAVGTGSNLEFGDNTTLDNSSGAPLTMATGTVEIEGSLTFIGTNDINFGQTSFFIGNSTLNVVAGNLSLGPITDSLVGFPTLLKTGNGTLILNSVGNTNPQIVLAGGALILGNATALNGAGLDITNPNATLNFGSATNVSLGTFSGVANLTLNNASGAGVAVSVTNSGSFLNPNGDNYSGVLSGNGSLTFSNENNLVLSGANTYSGGTTINEFSNVTIKNNSAFGTGAITFSPGFGPLNLYNNSGNSITLSGNNPINWTGGTFTYAGPNNLNLGMGNVILSGNNTINVTNGTLTVGGVISGNVALNTGGSSTLVLLGNNTYTGGTNISGGTLQLGANATLGPTTSLLNISSGNLDLGGTNQTVGNLTLSSGNLTNGTLISTAGYTVEEFSLISANLGGSGTLTVPSLGPVTLTGNNSYSGGTILSGTLQISGNGTMGAATGGLTIGGGVLDLGTTTQTVANVTLVSGTITNGTLVSTGGYNLQGGDISANLTGSGGLTMTGNGFASIDGTTTYSGGTLINSGTLQLGNYSADGSVLGNIVDNASLFLAPNSTSSQVFTNVISGNGSLTAENAVTLAAANTYTGATQLSFGTMTLDFSIAGAPATNIISSASALSLSYANLLLNGLAGTVNSQTFNGTTISAGANTISPISGSGGSMDLALGNLSRVSGATLNFYPATTGNLSVNPPGLEDGVITDLNGTAFVSVNNSDWANLSGGNVIALASYQTDPNPANWQPTDNVSVSANPSANLSNLTINTLKLAGNATLTINNGSVLALSTGGLLAVANSTNGIFGGTLTTGGGNELVALLAANSTINVSSVIADNGNPVSLTLSGAGGTMVLNAANTFSGNTNINSGVLILNHTAALQNSFINDNNSGLVFGNISSATVAGITGGSVSLSNASGAAVALIAAPAAGVSETVNTSFSGVGSLVKAGAGRLTIPFDTFLTNSGGVVLDFGTLIWNGPATVPGFGGLIINGGALDTTSTFQGFNPFSPNEQWNGNFTFVGSNNLDMGSGSVVLGASPSINLTANTLEIDGLISGNFGLTINGNGTLDLTHANTFTGGVVVNSGNLGIGNATAAGTGPITFNGGNLTFGSNEFFFQFQGNIASVLNMAVNGTIFTGSNFGSLTTLSGAISGNATLAVAGNGSNDKIFLGAGSTNILSSFNGTLSVQNRGASTALDFGNLSGNFGDSNFTLALGSSNVTVAPGGSGNSTITLGALTGGSLANLASTGNTTYVIGGNNLSTAYSGRIQGSTTLDKVGNGSLTLNGNDTYSGGTTINGGALIIGNLHALGLGTTSPAFNPTVTVNGGTLDLDGFNLTLNNLSGTGGVITDNSAGTGTTTLNLAFNAASNVTMAGVIADGASKTLALNVTGGNAIASLILSGANTFSGGTVIAANSNLTINNSLALQDSTLSYNTTGGNLVSLVPAYTLGGLSGNKALSLGAASGVVSVGTNDQSTTYTGLFSGAGSFVKIGSGVLTLTGVNNNVGNSTVANGTLLLLGSGRTGGTTSNLTITGGTLDLGSGSKTVGNFTISGGTLTNGTLSSTHGYLVQSGNINAALAGSGALTKSSSGSATLSSASFYTGGTIVSAGTLIVAYNGVGNVTGTGTVTVASNATLAGSGTIAGNVTINGTLLPGSIGAAGLLSFGSNLTVASNAAVDFQLGGSVQGTQYSTVNVAGNLSLNGLFALNLINGFAPMLANSFNLLQVVGAFSGSFADIVLPTLSSGLDWNLSQLDSSGSVSLAAPTTFAAWTADLGLTGANALPTAKPFTGGPANLIRYAMNLGTNATPAEVPQPTLANIGGTPSLSLQYRLRKNMTDYMLVPQYSTDLVNWASVGASNITQLADADTYTAQYLASAPLPASGTIFLRVVVQQE